MGATPTASTRYRPDELRRAASGLASGLGVAPARASALATHLLWFDAAGASFRGIATLPDWLGKLDRREIDPVAEGRAGQERAASAIFDAKNGLPPLALETAAGIASEKARDVGVGIVRVRSIGPTGPAAPVAAHLAIGPFVAAIAGPGPSTTIALPMPEGLPAIFDSALAGPSGEGRSAAPAEFLGDWSPWLATLSGGDGWLIVAVSVASIEPLAGFHERVSATFRGVAEGPGRLLPGPWEARRREAREHGVAVDPATVAALEAWSDRLGVPWPSPITP